MIKKLLITIFLFCISWSYSQDLRLSAQSTASVLTMGPGELLYDSFGHSAIRIQDPARGIDVVYNYGVYNFRDPQFYTKFAKGKLRYMVVRQNTEGFLAGYIEDNRWIKEQVLNLEAQSVQDLFNFLENNIQPENRAYNYDFLYDNCATKIPEVLQKVIPGSIQIDSSFVTEPKTFRQLIQENVYWNSWGSFGMDLGIGSVVDRPTTARQQLFLPEHVMLAFKGASIELDNKSINLVKETKDLFINDPQEPSKTFITSPFFVMLILGGFILWITYTDVKKQRRSRWLDVGMALTTGAIGIILCLLWFATEHSTTANNYNLLWAFPFNVFAIWQLTSFNPKPWLQAYIKFLLIIMALLCLHWIIGVQGFAFALIPLLIAMVVRYMYVIKFIKK